MGSNMAEAHPVGFQWVVEAKLRGAKVLHIDPRFTRTSALAHEHLALRAGTDIAFLGGVVNYILTNDLAFRDYVVPYTNASFLVDESYRDTEDLDGIFSGYDAETASWRKPYVGLAFDPIQLWKYGACGLSGCSLLIDLPPDPTVAITVPFPAAYCDDPFASATQAGL
jgi:anaerobic selenocysteine-containing dehydrogenase